MQIQLPKAGEWHSTENCAVNLRSVQSAGVKMCEPVGVPDTVLDDAGAAAYLLDGGGVLSVSDDRHDVFVNGIPAGSLPAPLINVLPLGRPGEAALFTDSGVHWLAAGKVQAPPPSAGNVTLGVAEVAGKLSATVLLSPLTGSYERLTGPINESDAEAVKRALADAMSAIAADAAKQGAFVNKVKVAWRMVDAAGQIVASGAPTFMGEDTCDDLLKFQMQSNGRTLSPSTAANLTAKPWRLQVAVARHADDFWRNKVARMELIAWPVTTEFANVGGMLYSSGGDTANLNVSYYAHTVEVPDGEPVVIADIDHPLNGVNITVRAEAAGIPASHGGLGEPLRPAAVYRGGTLTAYALADEPGVMVLASGREPLIPVSRHQICGGDIVQICAPVGGGGGWNYGRLHLLVFATDGIFSVSVDGKLRSATSTYVSYFGVTRADAVVLTPEAVYAATETGSLLRIVGSRCHTVPFPSGVSMLAWCEPRAELWAVNEYGVPFVMDSDFRVSMRSDVAVECVVGQHMIIDTFGALRTLRREIPAPCTVTWACRRGQNFRKSLRNAVWKIDAERASNLRLQLFADGGGTPQRLLELCVNGAINAPISARVISPSRAYFTARIHGSVTPPARLNSVSLNT